MVLCSVYGVRPSEYHPAKVVVPMAADTALKVSPILILQLTRRYFDNSENMNVNINMTIVYHGQWHGHRHVDGHGHGHGTGMDMDKNTPTDTNVDMEMDSDYQTIGYLLYIKTYRFHSSSKNAVKYSSSN
jgi:hypothetical protein